MADINISHEIMEALETYGENVTMGVNREAERCADGLTKDLQATSPRRTGRYSKSWKSKVTSVNPGGGEVHTVYSRKHYQLTHLLEKPHPGPYGHGFVEARPHIAQAEKHWNKEFEDSVEDLIEHG